MDSLIQNNYYTDKELLLFSYLHDSNNYILSQDLERFFVMLTKKHYLTNVHEK